MAEAGSSPKRRRTDNVPHAISPEQILQSNATVEHFMGQRHNRWMQGYQPTTANGAQGGTPAAARPGPQQMGNGLGGGAGGGGGRVEAWSVNGRPQEEHENEHNATAVTTMESNGVAAHVHMPTRRLASKAGATGSSHEVLAAGANTVDYDSPSNLVFPHSTDNNNIHPARTSSSVSNASGLPSPAHTEENSHSPAISASPGLADMDPPPRRRRGRPPGAAEPAAAAAHATNRSSSSNHQGQMQSTDRERLMQMNAYGAYPPPPPRVPQQMPPRQPQVPPTHQQMAPAHLQVPPTQQQMSPRHGPQPPSRPSSAMSVTPSSPAQQPSGTANRSAPAQQQSGTANRYSPAVLKQRIESFHQYHLEHRGNLNIDNGRLFLLHEAVHPHVDWFYVALSQTHALTAGSIQKLPEVARSVPKDAWNTLGALVCPNTMVSQDLLAFLAEFPASIETMYTDTISSSYSTYVTAAANFVRELPERWDRLVQQCWQRGAPPLSEDLVEDLALGSQVLQGVAFRAIARMIYNEPNDSGLWGFLEQLYRCDQETSARRGRRRSPAEKELIYPYFLRVRNGWTQYWEQKRIFDANQLQVPPEARQVWPTFQDAAGFQKSLAVLSGREAPEPPPPAAGIAQQNAMTPQQQQEEMARNQQRLAQQMRPPFQPQVNPQSPAQVYMPPRSSATQVPFSPRVNAHSPASFNMPPRPPSAQHNMPPRQPSAQHSVQARRNTQSPAQFNGLARPPFAGVNPAPMPVQQHQPSPRLVYLPEREGPRSQPTEPNSTRSALHQAHLRSPVPVPLQVGKETPQLYRYVCEWALSPRPLDKSKATAFFNFDLPQDKIDKLPKTIPSQNPGELPNRVLSELSQMYRLRCCRLQDSGFPTESDWVIADTHWPEELYLDFNGHNLETRLPLHHKKYLPIDLTKFVQPGANEIKATINRASKDPRPFPFAIAVEIVGVIAHSTIIKKVNTEQVVSAAITKAALQKRAGGTNSLGGDDDEVRATPQSVPVNLFDPFSGFKIFDTPVRGAACPHTECFDLETFLSQCKRDKEGAPTVVDCWRCPLCKKDVRPNKLVKDEWLVQVREQLARVGKLDTRTIMVEPDGSWKPKVERKTGVRSASLEAEERAARGANGGSGAARRKMKTVAEVIELD